MEDQEPTCNSIAAKALAYLLRKPEHRQSTEPLHLALAVSHRYASAQLRINYVINDQLQDPPEGNPEISLSVHFCSDPECPNTVYIPGPQLTSLDSDVNLIRLAVVVAHADLPAAHILAQGYGIYHHLQYDHAIDQFLNHKQRAQGYNKFTLRKWGGLILEATTDANGWGRGTVLFAYDPACQPTQKGELFQPLGSLLSYEVNHLEELRNLPQELNTSFGLPSQDPFPFLVDRNPAKTLQTHKGKTFIAHL